jgi:hypothetical protein
VTRDEINILKAVCVDLLHAAEVGAEEGLLDLEEAQMSRDLAHQGLEILAQLVPA